MLGMLGDKKKIVSIILGEQPKVEEKQVPNGLEPDFSSAYGAMAKSIIDAIKEGKPEVLASALKDFVFACDKEDDYTEDKMEE